MPNPDDPLDENIKAEWEAEADSEKPVFKAKAAEWVRLYASGNPGDEDGDNDGDDDEDDDDEDQDEY